MVAHLVRLKVAVLRNGLRRSPWQVVGLLLGIMSGIGVVLLVLAGLVALSFADTDLRADVLVLGGALVVLGWWLVPLVAFGADATLDPDRFVTFAIPRRTLLLGLATAALVGLPALATVVIAAATALSWWRAPLALLVGLVGAVLAVLTCVVGSRALTTLLAPVVGGRRFREAAAVLMVVPLFLLGPILSGLGTGLSRGADFLPEAAAVAAWTPLGAPWALAGAASEGSWGLLLARLTVSVVAVLVLAWVWDRALAAALERPGRSTAGRVRTAGLGWFGRLPATQVGAVAARSLTYWIRDPRYAGAVVIIPLMPVLLWFLGRQGGGGLMLALGPLAAYLMAWTISADISYDSTAFWTHVAAPVRGRVDRLGRVLAAALLGAPVALALTVLSLAISGRWEATVPLVALSISVLLTTLAVSSVISARVVYPVAKPGDNPFSSPQGGSGAAMVIQMVGTAALVGLLLPATGLTIAAVVTGSTLLSVLAVVVGLGIGGGLLALGIRIGGGLYDRRAPELLQSLVSMG